METDLEQMKCGECGETKHTLFRKPNGEIIVECVKCESKSIISLVTPRINIEHHSGNGTICVF